MDCQNFYLVSANQIDHLDDSVSNPYIMVHIMVVTFCYKINAKILACSVLADHISNTIPNKDCSET